MQIKIGLITSPTSWGGGIKTMVDTTKKFLNQREFSYAHRYPLFTKAKSAPERDEILANFPIPFDKTPWINHAIFGLKARHFARQTDLGIVVAATAHAALAYALTNRPFILWVATGYADELESKYKSTMGDQPARKLRNSVAWPILENMERICLRRAKHVFALSEHTLKVLTQLEPKIKIRSEVLAMPVPTDIFLPGNSKQTHQLIFTGRCNDPRKNTPLLFKAFALVKKQEPETCLTLIGDDLSRPLRQLANQLGIASSLKVIPNLQRDRLVPYLQEATLFVSTPTQEGLGISILEALACATPVVVTKCGGPEAIVANSQGGTITNHDPDEVAGAILRYLKDPALASKAGINARDYIMKNNLSENAVEQIFLNKILLLAQK